MTDQFDGHDLLLKAFQEIKSVQVIRLFARLCDSRIDNPDTSRIYLFLPDMHILTDKTRKKYSYGFNAEQSLVDLLRTIKGLQQTQQDCVIKVYHLGDFVDLWKEDLVDPRPILQDHQLTRNYLYSAGAKSSVNTQFLLGNHDVDLARVPLMKSRWDFRFFLPDNAIDKDLRIYVTHGDIFDPIEKLPKALKAWIVYHFSPKAVPPQEIADDLIVWKERNNKKFEKQFGDLLNVDPLIDADVAIFRDSKTYKYNVKNQNDPNKHKFLDGCFKRVTSMNQENGLHITAGVIGHTHRAGISVVDSPSEFFVLMDCGAWVGSFVEVSPNEERSQPIPRCQIGVVCGNDFRIYQLDPTGTDG